MPFAGPGQREVEDRRIRADRRSHELRRSQDRRHAERRTLNRGIRRDRRRSGNRRERQRRQVDDRRNVFDRRYVRRRCETPSPYTVEEAARVQRMFTVPGQHARCPACEGRFTLGRSHRRRDDTVRPIRCVDCNRSAIVTNCKMARIMVIERMDLVRDMVRTVLTSAGHEVVETPDAAAGLQLYRDNPADVVFINVLVAGKIDGGEFIRQLRKEFPDARVVAMSSRSTYGTADPLLVAQHLGAVRTMRIPVSRAEMLQVVEEARS